MNRYNKKLGYADKIMDVIRNSNPDYDFLDIEHSILSIVDDIWEEAQEDVDTQSYYDDGHDKGYDEGYDSGYSDAERDLS